MEITTTWILWAIISTVNPNVSYFAVIDEFPEPQSSLADCMITAKSSAPALADFLVEEKFAFEVLSVKCIPVATRSNEHAN